MHPITLTVAHSYTTGIAPAINQPSQHPPVSARLLSLVSRPQEAVIHPPFHITISTSPISPRGLEPAEGKIACASPRYHLTSNQIWSSG
jgi:hypothetical protein